MAFRLIRETNDYSFLNAKVQARRGLLLTTNDYEHLLSVEIEDGISYLQLLPRYQGYFEKINYRSPHLSLVLEKVLQENVYAEMQFLVQFAPNDAQEFFSFYMKKPYLKVLELIVQNLHKSPNEPLDLTNMFIPSPDEKIELELASKAVNFDELTAHISSEWLQRAIQSSLTDYRKSNNVLDILYSIERSFYIELWEEKITNLRIFEDEEEKMNLSAKDINAKVLVISQFTLYGDCRKGRRPSCISAALPEKAKALYEYFVECMKNNQLTVETGKFQAMMLVKIFNDGPVTILLDSEKIF